MTAPIVFTASEVPDSAMVALREWHNARPRKEYTVAVAAILSDPAIQSLMARKLVEAAAMSPGVVRIRLHADYSVYPPSGALIAALIPKEPDHD